MIDKKLSKKLNVFLTIVDKPKKGIPIAIKDNYLTEGIRTTAASFVLDDYIPQYSATVVKKLEQNGYCVVGKTNLDAWCHGSSTETSDYGPTLNPHNTKHLAGGSSGGSAAAVASGMVDFAMGSETAGSVRGPASWCGVVGLKPTYGRVSRYGVIAMGSSLDSPGPITKDVTGAAKLLKIIAGKDEFDATTSGNLVDDYELALTGDIKGLKVGLVENYMLSEMDSEIVKKTLKAVGLLEKLGAKITKVKTLDPTHAIGVYTVVQRSEVSSNLARFDGVRYGFGRDKFGEEAKRRIMLGTHILSSGYQDRYYKKAQKIRTLFINDFNELFSEFDCLVGPTMPSTAPKIGVTKNAAMYGELADILAEPSSIAGLPAITVPCGMVKGLPIGLQIIGKQFEEGKILNTAFAYEQNKKDD
ncbi:Asp-tRNA(Asn)/Glu-tRNA(Gln) amidotransferase subunit GatA [Candidatus Microgenomates bacterium]|nr:Asp-tRNA(Asn)/Glu-tRNA(Gln) amidotransferase subunit GatA [Candidatus Microgenomates bacterium]